MEATERKKQALKIYLDEKKNWEYWRAEVVRLAPLDTSITPSLSGMPHGGGPDGSKQELVVEELEDARARLTEAEESTKAARRRVLAIIETAENMDQRVVLLRRYITGMGWDKIAEAFGRSRQWATLVHGAALRSITLNEEEK